MIRLEPVGNDSPRLPALLDLYRSAFPANERRPLETLLDDESGAGEVLAALDGEAFIGLAILLTHGDLTHILYFAVPSALRGQGYGSRILEAVRADLDGRFKGIPADRIHIATAGSFASPENAVAWQKQVQEAFPDKEVRYDPLSCSVCCHTGMDAAGLGLSVIAR